MGGQRNTLMSRVRAFTLVEALTIIVLLLLCLAVLLPVFLKPARRTARSMQSGTQLRGIHQGMLLYSQGNGSFFPGLDRFGKPSLPKVEDRFKTLLEQNYFHPPYLVNAAEHDGTVAVWDGRETFSAKNYSYALLQLPMSGGRMSEWRDTSNPKALVISDRNAGSDADSGVQSLYTTMPGDWRGLVGFNDNSTQFLTTHRLDLKYGDADSPNDNIFSAAGDNDAYMIRQGND